jgi:hypothetical protein
LIAEALEKQLRLALPNEQEVDNAVQRLQLGAEYLKDAMTAFINDSILLGVDVGDQEINVFYGEQKVLDDIDLGSVAGDAIDWVTQRVQVLMQELGQTSRDTLTKMIAQWKDNNLPFSELMSTLEKAGWGFDPRRSKMIAVTEATRAFNKGKLMIAAVSTLTIHKRWITRGDERVCPICAKLGTMRFRVGEGISLGADFEHPGGAGAAAQFEGELFMQPPAHPNCGCKIRLVALGLPIPFTGVG